MAFSGAVIECVKVDSFLVAQISDVDRASISFDKVEELQLRGVSQEKVELPFSASIRGFSL